jgi:LmbE family N-acetylglucosaminyl deacetylase
VPPWQHAIASRTLPDPMLVISPHLDDAVLSCGQLLAGRPGSVVATIFAGVPRQPGLCTDWDRRCGFGSAAEAMARRREEDRAALARLGAQALWLDFCDAQYEQPAPAEDLRAALRDLLLRCRPERVLLPLGLYHGDHRQAHEAALSVCRECEVWLYEDVPYRGMSGVLQQRLAELQAMGRSLRPARLAGCLGAAEAKSGALSAYASQWRAFGRHGLDDAREPERCWALEPPLGRSHG